MKKLLKAIGLAALVGCIPYAVNQDKEKETFKIHALLWNAKVFKNEEGQKHIDIKVGFSNPFEHECCCGGNCHCHDGEDECCCSETAEEAAEPCCQEQLDGTCCCEAEETPSENPEII